MLVRTTDLATSSLRRRVAGLPRTGVLRRVLKAILLLLLVGEFAFLGYSALQRSSPAAVADEPTLSATNHAFPLYPKKAASGKIPFESTLGFDPLLRRVVEKESGGVISGPPSGRSGSPSASSSAGSSSESSIGAASGSTGSSSSSGGSSKSSSSSGGSVSSDSSNPGSESTEPAGSGSTGGGGSTDDGGSTGGGGSTDDGGSTGGGGSGSTGGGGSTDDGGSTDGGGGSSGGGGAGP